MSNTATTQSAEEFDVAEFIDGQLGMMSRRLSPEGRARIRWFRDRIKLLAKQQPGMAPVPTEPAHVEHPGHPHAA